MGNSKSCHSARSPRHSRRTGIDTPVVEAAPSAALGKVRRPAQLAQRSVPRANEQAKHHPRSNPALYAGTFGIEGARRNAASAETSSDAGALVHLGEAPIAAASASPSPWQRQHHSHLGLRGGARFRLWAGRKLGVLSSGGVRVPPSSKRRREPPRPKRPITALAAIPKMALRESRPRREREGVV